MDAALHYFATRQDDVVAAWQILSHGWTRRRIEHHRRKRGWRAIHRGVYALSTAPLRPRQRWIAATLTTPNSALSHLAGASNWGFLDYVGVPMITRPGNRGPRSCRDLIVHFSPGLEADVTRHDGIAVTSAARTLVDVASLLGQPATERAFREALRQRVTTIERIDEVLGRHPTRSGTSFLRSLTARYRSIPYGRTRSDAEALALQLLHDAGAEPPRVNVCINGEEADLVFVARRRIIELDGPRNHLFPDQDRRKERAWRAAGYEVHRLPTDAVYSRPRELLRLVLGP